MPDHDDTTPTSRDGADAPRTHRTLPAGVSVDEELRTVAWQAPPSTLVRRGLTFLVGIVAAATLLEVVGDRPVWALALAVAATAAPAAWLVHGLRHGWELEAWGLTIGTGTRRPERLVWQEVDRVRVVERPARRGTRWHAEVDCRDGRVRHLTPPAPSPARFEAAFEAADRLSLVPGRVGLVREPIDPDELSDDPDR